jgi:protoporphyrinogen oxidase
MNTLSIEDDTLILGGGLSGLAAAHYLRGRCTVVEAEQSPGGLCRSFEKSGFVYDIGGHVLFSKNTGVLEEMIAWLGPNVARRYRRNQIWYKDRFVKYPFENGLSALAKDEIFDCLMGFLQRKTTKPGNLAEWCRFRFGRGLASKYLIPYNQKIWKYDLAKMSTHWVDRIPSPPLEDIVKSAIGIETEGYTHQLHFFYPKRGGIQSLAQSLARSLPRVKTGYTVRSIKKERNVWRVSNGDSTVRARRLVSTIPLHDLIGSLEHVPLRVKNAVGRLKYNSLILVMVAVKHEGLSQKTALYIPDPKILPHRVCFMKYFSPRNAPPGFSHLVAEITVPPSSSCLRTAPSLLIEKVVSGIKDICDFSANDIILTDVQLIKYAYVIYDSQYLKNIRIVYDFLKSTGIQPLGRFGRFQYLNMDQCVEAAGRLVRGLPRTRD